MKSEIVESTENFLMKKTAENIERYDTRASRAKYPDTPEGLQKLKEDTAQYFKTLSMYNDGIANDSKPIIPTVEGWVTHLGLTRAGLSQVYYHGRGQAWRDFIDYVRENIAAEKVQGFLSGKIPQIAAIFDLTNNHGYYNTNSFQKDNAPVSAVVESEIKYPVLGNTEP